MSLEYVNPSGLKHYDEKIKNYINNKTFDSGESYDDTELRGLISDLEDSKVEKEEGKGLFSGSYNDLTDKPTIPSVDGLVSEETLNDTLSDYAKQSDIPTSLPASDVFDWAKSETKPTYTASEVGADTSGSASKALSDAKEYVDTKIDEIVGEGASTTLDTIGELSKEIEEHQDVTDALNSAIGNKVDKVFGKGLSTNDLTSTLKTNYDSAYTHSQSAHAPSTAEKNVIVGIQKNGTDLTVNSSTRKVNITVPTKTSELTNDSGFKTTDSNTTYSLSKSGSTITLTGSDGSTTSITDSNTTYTHPTTSGNKHIPSGGSSGQILRWSADGTAVWGSDNNTTYNVATSSANGLMSSTDKAKLDAITASADAVSVAQKLTSGTEIGTVTVNGTDTKLYAPTNTDTHYTTGLKVGASATATANASASNGSVYMNVLDNTTVRDSHNIVGSGSVTVTSDANGKITIAGTDTNTTYSNFVKSGTGAKAGLVPAPSTTAGTTKYLREDGTWATPPDTTYSAATTSANGLMSATDKTKLDGITESADSVSFTRSLTSGTKIGTITINGTGTDLYCQTNTDTKVTNTLNTTTKAYITGTTSATTNTGTQIFDTGVYLSATEGQLGSTSLISQSLLLGTDGMPGSAGSYSINLSSAYMEPSSCSIAMGSSYGSAKNYSISQGYYSKAENYASHALGHYNKAMTTGANSTTSVGDVLVVGNGTGTSATSNAFRVTYTGAVYGKSAFNSSGADYAEFIKPWWDDNENDEDRVGYFVTVKDGFLHKANEGDYIVGITSGNPSVVGNADEDYYWMYERDEFDRVIYEDIPETIQQKDENGIDMYDEETYEPILIETGNIIKNGRAKLSKNYDNSLQDTYVERKDRKEWDYVGMIGILAVRDDGTCEAGSFCKCSTDGIATLATERGFDTYMVIERVNDNVVKVVLK